MIKNLLMATALLTAVACSNSDSPKKKDAPADDQNKTVNAEQTTDTTECKGETPAGASVFANDWQLNLEFEGTKAKAIVRFTANSMEVVNESSRGEAVATAQTSAAAEVSEAQALILENKKDEKQLETAEGSIPVQVELKKDEVYKFSFEGPCLKVAFPDGNVGTFIPAK